MTNSGFKKALASLFSAVEPVENDSQPERLGLPHTFKPQLSFLEAVIAAAGAFLRILLGSALFGFWGAYSVAVWLRTRALALRITLLLLLLTAFVAAMGLMLYGVRALVRAASPRRPRP